MDLKRAHDEMLGQLANAELQIGQAKKSLRSATKLRDQCEGALVVLRSQLNETPKPADPSDPSTWPWFSTLTTGSGRFSSMAANRKERRRVAARA